MMPSFPHSPLSVGRRLRIQLDSTRSAPCSPSQGIGREMAVAPNVQDRMYLPGLQDTFHVLSKHKYCRWAIEMFADAFGNDIHDEMIRLLFHISERVFPGQGLSSPICSFLQHDFDYYQLEADESDKQVCFFLTSKNTIIDVLNFRTQAYVHSIQEGSEDSITIKHDRVHPKNTT